MTVSQGILIALAAVSTAVTVHAAVQQGNQQADMTRASARVFEEDREVDAQLADREALRRERIAEEQALRAEAAAAEAALAERRAALLEAEGNAAAALARDQADRERLIARRRKSTARAVAGASGVLPDVGSPLLVQAETLRLGFEQAQETQFLGELDKRNKLLASANALNAAADARLQGRDALFQSDLSRFSAETSRFNAKRLRFEGKRRVALGDAAADNITAGSRAKAAGRAVSGVGTILTKADRAGLFDGKNPPSDNNASGAWDSGGT
tara:strand:- start:371 stop:1183 length:813 start_codon:yes stop_codon:yes gene_type:complete